MRLSMNVTSPPAIRRADSAIEDRFGALIDGDFLQLRKLPAPDADGKPIRQVLLIPPEDFVLHEIWSGPGHLELCKSGLYPHLHKLAPVEVLETWYLKASWVVPYPKTVWESS